MNPWQINYHKLREICNSMNLWEKSNRGQIPKALLIKANGALIRTFMNSDWELGSQDWLPAGIEQMTRSEACLDMAVAALTPIKTGRFRYWLTNPNWSTDEQREAVAVRANFVYYKLTETLLGPVAREEVRRLFQEHDMAWQAPPDFQSRAIKRLRDEGYVLIDPKHSEYLVGLDRINEWAAELTELEGDTEAG